MKGEASAYINISFICFKNEYLSNYNFDLLIGTIRNDKMVSHEYTIKRHTPMAANWRGEVTKDLSGY
jgi:hypothetical protein